MSSEKPRPYNLPPYPPKADPDTTPSQPGILPPLTDAAESEIRRRLADIDGAVLKQTPLRTESLPAETPQSSIEQVRREIPSIPPSPFDPEADDQGIQSVEESVAELEEEMEAEAVVQTRSPLRTVVHEPEVAVPKRETPKRSEPRARGPKREPVKALDLPPGWKERKRIRKDDVGVTLGRLESLNRHLKSGDLKPGHVEAALMTFGPHLAEHIAASSLVAQDFGLLVRKMNGNNVIRVDFIRTIQEKVEKIVSKLMREQERDAEADPSLQADSDWNEDELDDEADFL